MERPGYYGVFALFVSILIFIFLIWENEYSRVVVLTGVILIMIVSVLEILLGINVSEIPSDYEDSHFLDYDSKEKSLKIIDDLEKSDKKKKKEVI